ncbi:AAA domain-containing protein [Thermodesulfobacteriota bacterium]
MFDQGKLEKPEILPCFKGNVAYSILNEVFGADDALHFFNSKSHESRIERFKRLDLQLCDDGRERLKRRLRERVPSLLGASHGSPEWTLQLELPKTKNLKSIRKLFREAGDLIQEIKPCVMMSPLSIAQFLEPGTVKFDTVIFDEASQVKPADSYGAILRGKQLVVFGDEKQLPPTSFFDKNMEPGDDDAITEVMDSILDVCVAQLPGEKLKWHYRSEHESLIAISNIEFYDNGLLVFPSANKKGESLGLHFEHVPEGVYDMGGSSTNTFEAQTVAQRALEHFSKYPHLTLGIGTFSEKQRNAVEDWIERLFVENPGFEKWANKQDKEPLFVKNLEIIQGDERDVIFISIGYGFDADHKLAHNFGPLNRNGGEKRLNVLISRARKKCVVFSNLRASDLKVESLQSHGPKCLKVFLDYAESGTFPQPKPIGFDSEFERMVHDALKKHGVETVPQVGCAGYRIDLGVRNSEGRYVLGIECDGRQYHSSVVARERDRLRQQVLERLGWRIHRVWSTDWFHNRKETENRLLEAVRSAQEEPEAVNRKTETGKDPEPVAPSAPAKPTTLPPPTVAVEPKKTHALATPARPNAGTAGTAPPSGQPSSSHPKRKVRKDHDIGHGRPNVREETVLQVPDQDTVESAILLWIHWNNREIDSEEPGDELIECLRHVATGHTQWSQCTFSDYKDKVRHGLERLTSSNRLSRRFDGSLYITDTGKDRLKHEGLLAH